MYSHFQQTGVFLVRISFLSHPWLEMRQLVPVGSVHHLVKWNSHIFQQGRLGKKRWPWRWNKNISPFLRQSFLQRGFQCPPQIVAHLLLGEYLSIKNLPIYLRETDKNRVCKDAPAQHGRDLQTCITEHAHNFIHTLLLEPLPGRKCFMFGANSQQCSALNVHCTTSCW